MCARVCVCLCVCVQGIPGSRSARVTSPGVATSCKCVCLSVSVYVRELHRDWESGKSAVEMGRSLAECAAQQHVTIWLNLVQI